MYGGKCPQFIIRGPAGAFPDGKNLALKDLFIVLFFP
jgi:hypothetical protein